MKQNVQRSEPPIDEIDLFLCESGCVHLEFGPTLLSFSHDVFDHIAMLFDEVRQEISAVREPADDWSDEIITDI